jgi:uncharacterized protein
VSFDPPAPETPPLAPGPAFAKRLHDAVDGLVTGLEQVHAGRLRCGAGCVACCTDDLTVFAIEADLLRARYPALLAEGRPHAVGACAMLDDDGRCRVYAERPYVCRTQGLPLRWLEEEVEDGVPVVYEGRDICPLNVDGGPPVEELPAAECWAIGPFEARLLAVQQAQDGGVGQRVPLRALFAADAGRDGPDVAIR